MSDPHKTHADPNQPASAPGEGGGDPNPNETVETARASVAPDTAAATDVDQRIQDLEAELAEAKDRMLRALAEAQNIQRRAVREREDAQKYAVSGFARDLLAVSDNLHRALEVVPADAVEGNELLKNLVLGVEATERQLLDAFQKAGIEKLDPQDQPFDPNFHRAMFENTGKPAGTVVQVLQPGYVINGRLLREAMVGVAKADSGQGTGRVDTQA